MEVTPEIEAHHHKHTGHWVDYLLGGAAIAISLISLYLGIKNAEHMERLVEANSYPEILFGQGNAAVVNGTEIPQIHLDLVNLGVGPARIETFEIFYKNKPVANNTELLQALIADTPAGSDERKVAENFLDHHMNNSVHGQLIAARDRITFLHSKEINNSDPGFQEISQKVGQNVSYKFCYCSIFNECYFREPKMLRPKHVEACEATQAVQHN